MQSKSGIPSSKQATAKSGPDDPKDNPGPTSEFALIEVYFEQDGTPSVDPAEGMVEAGGDVVWRGAPGEPRPFQVNFPSGNPTEAGVTQTQAEGASSGSNTATLVLQSTIEEGCQTCRLTTTKHPTHHMYKYKVKANGSEIEALLVIQEIVQIPDIIIHPRHNPDP